MEDNQSLIDEIRRHHENRILGIDPVQTIEVDPIEVSSSHKIQKAEAKIDELNDHLEVVRRIGHCIMNNVELDLGTHPVFDDAGTIIKRAFTKKEQKIVKKVDRHYHRSRVVFNKAVWIGDSYDELLDEQNIDHIPAPQRKVVSSARGVVAKNHRVGDRHVAKIAKITEARTLSGRMIKRKIAKKERYITRHS